MFPLFGQADPLMLPGVIGGLVLGYFLGAKLRHVDASAPSFCAIVGGIFGAVLLRWVLAIAILVAIFVGPPVALWYCRDLIRRLAGGFGQTAGVTYKQLMSRRSHRTKIQAVEDGHQERLASLYEADLPRDSLEKLLEQERRRFDAELQDVSREA